MATKLSNADRNRILARSLFVDAEKSFAQIAETLAVSEKTISNYQSKDKAEGFDWLTLRASKVIETSQDKKENMYAMFTSYMMDSLKEIRENENLSSEEKTKAIVSLGDSFSKMRKIAAAEDPEAYKFGIMKITIKTILEKLKETLSTESMETVIETINLAQEELSDVVI